MCIVIIRSNSLVGGHAWSEARTSATEHITLYCTWRPRAVTTRPHGQVLESKCADNNENHHNHLHLLHSAAAADAGFDVGLVISSFMGSTPTEGLAV